MSTALSDVAAERQAQEDRWGEQNHPDGTGDPFYAYTADLAKRNYEIAVAQGGPTWRHILHEEVLEAFAEDDPARLREELIQVAAVAVAWAEAIDRRESK